MFGGLQRWRMRISLGRGSRSGAAGGGVSAGRATFRPGGAPFSAMTLSLFALLGEERGARFPAQHLRRQPARLRQRQARHPCGDERGGGVESRALRVAARNGPAVEPADGAVQVFRHALLPRRVMSIIIRSRAPPPVIEPDQSPPPALPISCAKIA